MKTAIIGAGGVGGYFGAKMAKAGCDVTFLARGKQASVLKKSGLTIKSIHGDFHVENLNVKESIKEIGEVDLIILCVKAWQVKEIRSELKSIMHNHNCIIPTQNGILAADELLEVIDRSNVFGGVCKIFSKVESPGVINHFGANPTLVFGELDGSVSKQSQDVKAFFDSAGVNSQISADIHADLWKKFIAICIGGLLAVSNTTYGELKELKETRQMMIELLNEIYILSQEVGINIEPDFVDNVVSNIDTFPPDSTASLTRDIWEGKPSEIYYQNGTVARLGEEYGVDTPINRFVFNCILPGELKARKTYCS